MHNATFCGSNPKQEKLFYLAPKSLDTISLKMPECSFHHRPKTSKDKIIKHKVIGGTRDPKSIQGQLCETYDS